MTIKQLQETAPPLAGLVLALALLFTLAALRQFRKSRRDSYWRRRRNAGQQGWRLMVVALFLTLVSGLVCSLSGVAGLVLRTQITPTAVVLLPTATDTPTLLPTATLTPTIFVPTSAPLSTDPPTETDMPPTQTVSPTYTPALTSTSTSTVIPTNTSAVRPSPLVIATATETPTVTVDWTPKSAAAFVQPTLQSSVTPASNSRLTITALDYEISGALGPVKPATSFAPGFNRIYYFVNFANMQGGVVWRGVLVLNGNVIQHYERLWGTAQNGSGYFFFGQENGFQAGNYEIRLYLGEATEPTASATFRVEGK